MNDEMRNRLPWSSWWEHLTLINRTILINEPYAPFVDELEAVFLM